MAISSDSSSAAQTTPSLGYRAEIDGLRAIAVLAVVLYHARLGALGGGYAGVDVFFVISGFLISRLISEEFARSGRFSLVNFYERRIRRLLPALSLVVLATLMVGWFQLPPNELQRLASSAFAALAFFSNLHFAKQAGYFQPNAETQPLLHTWSLGVEEQFYILAPFVIVGLLKLSLPLRRRLLGVLILASLAFAVFSAFKLRDAAFFWPHTRAYELLLGVMLGLRIIPLPQGERMRMVLSAIGLCLIVASLALLPPGIFFPSYWALLPCLGAVMIIAATEGGAIPGLPGRLLSAAPMRFFGKISYSLYLWHWPLLVYATLASEAPLTLPVRLGLIAAAIALSWASYRFVEQPARHAKVPGRLATVFLPTLLLIGAGFVFSNQLQRNNGYPARFGPAMTRLIEGVSEPRRQEIACVGGVCKLGDERAPVSFVIWGDSHARAIAPELSDVARARGLAGVLVGRDGCPPILNAEAQSLVTARKCQDAVGSLHGALQGRPGLKVIISARWALYAETQSFGHETGIEPRPMVPGGREANRRAFLSGLPLTVRLLQNKGADIRVLGSVPEHENNIPAVLARRVMRGETGEFFVERARFDARQTNVFLALEAVRGQGAKVLYPHEILCDAARCRASEDGLPLYFDDDHLSLRGANRLRALLGQALE